MRHKNASPSRWTIKLTHLLAQVLRRHKVTTHTECYTTPCAYAASAKHTRRLSNNKPIAETRTCRAVHAGQAALASRGAPAIHSRRRCAL